MGNWTDSDKPVKKAAKLAVHNYVLLYCTTYKNKVCFQTINGKHCIVRALAVQKWN